MKDVLQYNEFIGSVHFDADDAVFYGKIEGISDLVTFEGESVTELQQAFKDAIEDYIEIGGQKGKAIHKSYKGNLNVKISAELHRKAMQKSLILPLAGSLERDWFSQAPLVIGICALKSEARSRMNGKNY